MKTNTITRLVEKCNRKVICAEDITAEVRAIGHDYNLYTDLKVFNSRHLFGGKVLIGNDFLLDNFKPNEYHTKGLDLPQHFIYIREDGSMYFVDTQGYNYMRCIAKIVN